MSTDQSRPSSPAGDITWLLRRVEAGEESATDRLFPLVYDELRQLARAHMAQERTGHTLQPTALVNEAYLRLVGSSPISWENRGHFFAAAARAIRRILVEHARARGRLKRGGDAQREPLDAAEIPLDDDGPDLVALDDALDRLAAHDAQKARVVELRFFAGLSVAEAARVVGVSESTIAREWRFARAWLHRELAGEERS